MERVELAAVAGKVTTTPRIGPHESQLVWELAASIGRRASAVVFAQDLGASAGILAAHFAVGGGGPRFFASAAAAWIIRTGRLWKGRKFAS